MREPQAIPDDGGRMRAFGKSKRAVHKESMSRGAQITADPRIIYIKSAKKMRALQETLIYRQDKLACANRSMKSYYAKNEGVGQTRGKKVRNIQAQVG